MSLPDVSLQRLDAAGRPLLAVFFAALLAAGLDRSFHPHPFTDEAAALIATSTGEDWYGGAFVQKSGVKCEMAGYVMLRGWDAGYDIPAFGVCVLPAYQSLGLGRLLLDWALLTARLRGSPAVRLKVYPDNQHAVALYEQRGFRFTEGLEQGQRVAYFYFGRGEGQG